MVNIIIEQTNDRKNAMLTKQKKTVV